MQSSSTSRSHPPPDGDDGPNRPPPIQGRNGARSGRNGNESESAEPSFESGGSTPPTPPGAERWQPPETESFASNGSHVRSSSSPVPDTLQGGSPLIDTSSDRSISAPASTDTSEFNCGRSFLGILHASKDTSSSPDAPSIPASPVTDQSSSRLDSERLTQEGKDRCEFEKQRAFDSPYPSCRASTDRFRGIGVIGRHDDVEEEEAPAAYGSTQGQDRIPEYQHHLHLHPQEQQGMTMSQGYGSSALSQGDSLMHRGSDSVIPQPTTSYDAGSFSSSTATPYSYGQSSPYRPISSIPPNTDPVQPHQQPYNQNCHPYHQQQQQPYQQQQQIYYSQQQHPQQQSQYQRIPEQYHHQRPVSWQPDPYLQQQQQQQQQHYPIPPFRRLPPPVTEGIAPAHSQLLPGSESRYVDHGYYGGGIGAQDQSHLRRPASVMSVQSNHDPSRTSTAASAATAAPHRSLFRRPLVSSCRCRCHHRPRTPPENYHDPVEQTQFETLPACLLGAVHLGRTDTRYAFAMQKVNTDTEEKRCCDCVERRGNMDDREDHTSALIEDQRPPTVLLSKMALVYRSIPPNSNSLGHSFIFTNTSLSTGDGVSDLLHNCESCHLLCIPKHLANVPRAAMVIQCPKVFDSKKYKTRLCQTRSDFKESKYWWGGCKKGKLELRSAVLFTRVESNVPVLLLEIYNDYCEFAHSMVELQQRALKVEICNKHHLGIHEIPCRWYAIREVLSDFERRASESMRRSVGLIRDSHPKSDLFKALEEARTIEEEIQRRREDARRRMEKEIHRRKEEAQRRKEEEEESQSGMDEEEEEEAQSRSEEEEAWKKKADLRKEEAQRKKEDLRLKEARRRVFYCLRHLFRNQTKFTLNEKTLLVLYQRLFNKTTRIIPIPIRLSA